jgi:hypothetical protein
MAGPLNQGFPPGCERYLEWFWLLSTERAIGISVGPIPMSSVFALADRIGLDEEMTGVLLLVISVLDGVYMGWISESGRKGGGPSPAVPSSPSGGKSWPAKRGRRR